MNNKSFNNLCNKDIKEIFLMVDEYLPKLDDWYLDQSVIFDDDKKIICNKITDKRNNKVGYQIRIHLFNSRFDIYKLLYKKDSIILKHRYHLGKKMIKEVIDVSFKNDKIMRNIIYSDNNDYVNYNEEYDVNNEYNDYLLAMPICDILDNIKNKNKIRKRT